MFSTFFSLLSDKKTRVFFVLSLFINFFISTDYAIAKPVINSLFLSHYSAKMYPYAWFLAVPANFLIVSLYNRWIERIGCFRMFNIISSITVFLHSTSVFFLESIPGLPLVLYVWKDIYILLLFQQIWSVIHSSTKLQQATYFYGIVFALGTCGSIFGSLLSARFATTIGSHFLLLFSLPIHLLLTGIYFWFLRASSLANPPSSFSPKGKPQISSQKWGDFTLIRKSRPLLLILLTVVFMQFSTTLIDYQFHSALQVEIPDQDLRTAFLGKLWTIVSSASLLLQLFAGFLLVRFLGFKKSQLFLPMMLFCNVIGCAIFPLFSMFAYAFSFVKMVDYSVFNIIKEMLYVPLSEKEKFKARAIIDIFAYRAAKALASLFILSLQLFYMPLLQAYLMWSTLGLYLLWTGVVAWIGRKKKQPFSFPPSDENGFDPFPLP